MPRKPLKPCRYPGCPKLTAKRYCKEHERIENRWYRTLVMDEETRNRYDAVWERARARYKAEHPFCEKCFDEGRLVPMQEVHHIIPLAEGGTHDQNNLMSLCKSCHSRLHATRGDRWGKNNLRKHQGR